MIILDCDARMKVGIQAIEYYLPENLLSNEDLALLYSSWSAKKIFEKTGIKSRHIALEGECVSDMAEKAALKLFARAKDISPDKIDFVILVTETADYKLPSTACILQDRLGIPTTAGALDINLGCSGYVYALKLAKALVASGESKNVLLLTGDVYSRYIHPMDKSTRTLFGDASTASWITNRETVTSITNFTIGTNGAGYDNFIIPAGGVRIPNNIGTAMPVSDASGNIRSDDNIYMNGQEIMLFTIEVVPQSIDELLSLTGLTMNEVDWFVFHQANSFILEYLRKKLHIPEHKFFVCLEDTGNTVSSSIPIALKRLANSVRSPQKGDRIMLVGFGVGLSWGATMIEYGGIL